MKRVVNHSGPQTVESRQFPVCQRMPHTVTESSVSRTTEFTLPVGIHERLSSMEAHVKLSSGKYSRGVLNFHKELAVLILTPFTWPDHKYQTPFLSM